MQYPSYIVATHTRDNILISESECYFFFNIVATIYCAIDKESNRIPEEGRVITVGIEGL
jgi:hypothetical protein